jgi:hypothetical protein
VGGGFVGTTVGGSEGTAVSGGGAFVLAGVGGTEVGMTTCTAVGGGAGVDTQANETNASRAIIQRANEPDFFIGTLPFSLYFEKTRFFEE